MKNSSIMIKEVEAQRFKIPSIYDGDVPILMFTANSPTGETVECGRLWGKGGVLSFEGNAEESAKLFFEQVILRNKEYLMRSNKE